MPRSDKIPPPPKEKLEELLKDLTMTTISKRFGVSLTTVRKWMVEYDIDYSSGINSVR